MGLVGTELVGTEQRVRNAAVPRVKGSSTGISKLLRDSMLPASTVVRKCGDKARATGSHTPWIHTAARESVGSMSAALRCITITKT